MDEKNIKVENNPPLSNVLVSLLNKKKPLIILIVLLLIITIALLAVMFKSAQLKQGSKTPEQNTTVSPAVSSKTANDKKNKEIIKEAIAYIESQRRPDGFYEYVAHYDEQCTLKDGKKDCPFNGTRMFETTNAWTALAHFAAYKALGDKSELEKANRDLAKLIDWCAPDPKKCLWVLAQPAIIYQDTKDPKILAFLKNEGVILADYPLSDNMMLASIEARGLSLIYKITKDTSLLSSSKKKMEQVILMLPKQKNTYRKSNISFGQFSCWLALANVNLEYTEKSGQMLANTQTFLDNGKIEENFPEFPNPVEIQPCIESYLEIYSVSKDTKTLSKVNTLINLFLENFVDSASQKWAYGEEATMLFSKNNNDKGVNKKLSILTDSSYTTFLMYRLINEN